MIGRLAAATLLCLWLCGCATGMVRSANRAYASVGNEIRAELMGNPRRPSEGLYLGETQLAGKNYSHYQFPDVLIGRASQALHVYVPVTNDHKALGLITEAPLMPMSNSPPAYLYLGYAYSPWEYQPQPPTPGTHSVDWLSGSGGHGWIRRLGATDQDWTQCQATVRVAWQCRRKTTLLARDLKYLYTVPFDVVTSPVQLILALTVKP